MEFWPEPLFKNRENAGKKLGEALKGRHFERPYVLALPRGGVTVAKEVAEILQAPLDVVVSRKIGSPGHREYGIGAISEDINPLMNPSVKNSFDFESTAVKHIIEEEKEELKRRVQLYRDGQEIPQMEG